MKRITRTIIVLLVGLGILAVPTAANAAVYNINGCILSYQYPPFLDNGLTFSYENGLFYTPIRRAGACRHVYVRSSGVFNAPPCFSARIRTYNEDRTPRVDGPYMRFDRVGQILDLRPTIENMRLYRIFAIPCASQYRDPGHPPGYDVFTHVG
jgi:hypothetical protein